MNKSAKNLWPSFIYTTLINKRVTDVYKDKCWQLVPQLWRHWWIDTLPIFNENYNTVTLDYPESIIKDRSSEIEEWKNDIGSQMLPRIVSSCNKHIIPCSKFL